MATVGYATLQIVPSMKGARASITKELNNEIASAATKAGAGATKVGRSIGTGVASGVKQTIGAVGSVISGTLLVGVGALSAFGAKAISAGVAFNKLSQTSRAALTTLLGSAKRANAQMDALDEFASKSPFAREVFITAQQQMIAFGFAAKDVLPTLGAIQDAVAAAGGSSEQIGEIADILATVKSTGKITGDTLNQLGYRGIDAARLIGQSLGKSGNQIRESITEGTLDSDVAIRALVKSMNSEFGGAAANVKKTWAGATDRIRAGTRNLGSALVEPFISKKGGGAAIVWANSLADIMSKLVPFAKMFAAKLAKAIGPGITNALKSVNTFLAHLRFADVAAGFKQVTAAVAPFKAALLPLAGLGAGVFSGFLKQLPGIGALLPGISGPLGLIIGLVATLIKESPALGDAFLGVLQQIQPVLELIPTLLAQLTPLLAPLGDALAVAIGSLEPVLAALPGLLVALMPSLTSVAEAFVQLVTAATPLIPAAASILESLIPVAEDVMPVLAQTIADVVSQVAELVTWLVDKLGDKLPLVVGGLAGLYAALRIQRAVVPKVTGRYDKLKGSMEKFGKSAKVQRARVVLLSAAQKVLAFTTKVFTAAWKALSWAFRLSPIGAVITLVVALIAAIVLLWKNNKKFKEIVQNAWNAVWRGIKWVGQKIAALWDWLVENADRLPGMLFRALLKLGGLYRRAWLWVFGVVGKVIAWGWKQVVNYFKSIPHVLVFALRELLPKLAAFLVRVGRKAKDKWIEWNLKLIDEAKKLPGKILDAVGALFGKLNDLWKRIRDKVPVAWAHIREDIVKKAGEVVDGVVDALESLPQKISENKQVMTTGAYETGKDWLQSFANGVRENGAPIAKEMMRIWATSLLNNSGAIFGFFARLPGRATRAMVRIIPLTMGVWRRMFGAWITLVQLRWRALLAIFKAMPKAIYGALRSLPGLVEQVLRTTFNLGITLARHFSRTVSSIARELPGKVHDALVTIHEKIGNVWDKVKRDAATAWENIRTTVGQKASAVADEVGKLPGKIAAKLAGLYDAMYRIGRDAVQGLINGIITKSGELVNAVKTWIIDKLPAPVRKALGVDSPSKVFAEIGRNIQLGLAVGIRDGENAIVAALQDTGDAITETMNDSLDTRAATLRAAGESLSAASAREHLRWQVQPAASDPTLPALAWRQRSTAVPAQRNAVPVVYVQNPFTGEYLLATMDDVATQRATTVTLAASRARQTSLRGGTRR